VQKRRSRKGTGESHTNTPGSEKKKTSKNTAGREKKLGKKGGGEKRGHQLKIVNRPRKWRGSPSLPKDLFQGKKGSKGAKKLSTGKPYQPT